MHRALALACIAAASTSSSSRADTPASAPTRVVVVSAAGVDDRVEQEARRALAAHGSDVMSADATRASLASAKELGLDCASVSDDAGDCWRRVAALAHEDAVVVVHADAHGVALRLLDARADVDARDAKGTDVASAVAALFGVAATDEAPTPPVTTTTTTTPATPAKEDAFVLPFALGGVSAGIAIASGVSALVVQQVVLADPSAPRSTKATAYGAGLVLLGGSALFAVGAVVGGVVGAVSLEEGAGS